MGLPVGTAWTSPSLCPDRQQGPSREPPTLGPCESVAAALTSFQCRGRSGTCRCAHTVAAPGKLGGQQLLGVRGEVPKGIPQRQLGVGEGERGEDGGGVGSRPRSPHLDLPLHHSETQGPVQRLPGSHPGPAYRDASCRKPSLTALPASLGSPRVPPSSCSPGDQAARPKAGTREGLPRGPWLQRHAQTRGEGRLTSQGRRLLVQVRSSTQRGRWPRAAHSSGRPGAVPGAGTGAQEQEEVSKASHRTPWRAARLLPPSAFSRRPSCSCPAPSLPAAPAPVPAASLGAPSSKPQSRRPSLGPALTVRS